MAMTSQSVDFAAATPEATTQLAAVLDAAGIMSLDNNAWIRVTGEDRVRWLNGMVTNLIQELTPGGGCYNFVLNAQGRILGDLTAFMLEDSILLETSRDQVDKILAHLEHFIIMDDVELTDISDRRKGILIAGPQALQAVQSLGGAPCSASPPPTLPATDINLKQTAYRGATVSLIHAYSPLVPRFEIWAEIDTMNQIAAELGSLPKSTAQALEHLRILEGTPLFGTDIRNSETAHDLPQETAPVGVPHRALHFSKGCYLGQEIVERIHSRGNIRRTFTGFELKGTLPAPGTTLQAEGKTVGELTSVSAILCAESAAKPAGNAVQLALGYIRREALDRRLTLEYPGGIATPIVLPYTASETIA